jgi:small subunit ribosomal protein S5
MRKDGFNKRQRNDERGDWDQRVVEISRVTRVMAGGKRMRFRALVVIGDNKNKVGFGIGKGADVSGAIQKATNRAHKNIIEVPMHKNTIPHEVRAKYGSALVLLKPAPVGTGIIAGGPVRVVLGVSGIPNVVAKMLGSANKLNNVRVVFKALSSFKLKI